MAKPFIEIPHEQLFAIVGTDEGNARIIRYVHAARRAGRPDLAADALIILIAAEEWVIRGYVKRGLPDEEVEEATLGAIEELAKSVHANPPEATNIAHLRKWMSVVIARYTAGIYRNKGERTRMESASLDYAYEDGESQFNRKGGIEEPGYESVAYMEIVQKHFDDLSEDHQVVISYSVFGNLSSKEVSDLLAHKHGLVFKPNNIDKIASRFRRNCQDDLEEQ